ncbi:hypothetical protein SAMN05421819_3284 [Bryocella elongata]|uniref:DUF5666 domain-containing protein n=1 Tax=Bryocella elongata TaxID=863522 RepID=A0A1H6AUF9_9BACT|nr:hypothetical protein [Bryocella elongata]SEG52273.1 hypothetical protein SAMN05421819_3284 [Bryocella elongata]
MQLKPIFFLGVLLMACSSVCARAQMSVHALSGVVKAVGPMGIDVQIGSDTTTHFKLAPGAKVAVNFDGGLRSDSVAANEFHHVGAFIVVYFYGYGSDVTAVAVKELNAGPYAKVEGRITDYDRRGHKMTLTDADGKTHSFTLADHLIVDSDEGADDGRKFSPRKGDDVRVTYASSGTQGTVSFIHASL